MNADIEEFLRCVRLSKKRDRIEVGKRPARCDG
jgi:hypothetical protein